MRLRQHEKPTLEQIYAERRQISSGYFARLVLAPSTRTKAGSLTRGTPGVRTTLRRIGLPANRQNANHRIPNTIAANTSVKKCTPKAMRLNPTKAISNGALKIVSLRQWRAFIAGRIKRAS